MTMAASVGFRETDNDIIGAAMKLAYSNDSSVTDT